MPQVTQGPANLLVPGVYVNVLPPQNAVSPYVNTSLNAFVGGANWGPVNTPVRTSDATSAINAFGNDTVSANSLVLELLNSLTEDGNCVSVRATDGTDVAATIVMKDASAGTVLTLTAIYTGSLPNGNPAINVPAAGCRIDLVSGTSSSSPVFRITIFFPGQPPEVFNNIIGSATPSGPYNSTTFLTNALAAINGTAQNSIGSQRWIASAGSSTLVPVTGTVTNATGGSDGTAGLGYSQLIGVDTVPRTGMYALRGTGFFHFAIAGGNNLAYFSTVSAFVQSEGAALGFFTVPKGTSDSSAYGLQIANGAFANNMVLVKDYIYIYDSVQNTFRYVSPLGKAMGIIGLCPPEVSPINEPWNITGNGAAYVIGTEQSAIGPRSTADLAALITNGWICITNQIALANGSFGIFDDVCSSGSPQSNNGAGTYIPVTRMDAFLAAAFVQLGGPFIGKNQTTLANDPLRAQVAAAYNNFLSQLAPNGGTPRINSWQVTCDLTNNTPTSIAAGFLYVKILVRFLGVVRIMYVTLQGGTNVTISTSPPQPPA